MRKRLLNVLIVALFMVSAMAQQRILDIYKNGVISHSIPVTEIDSIKVNMGLNAPQNLTVSLVGDAVVLSWKKVEGTTNYEVYRSGNNRDYSLLTMLTTHDGIYPLGSQIMSCADLEPLSGYNYYKVKAVGENVCSELGEAIFYISNSITIDPTIYHGQADEIDYRTIPTEETLNSAISTLSINFGQFQAAQYSLRGGKDGQLPGAHMYQYAYSYTVDNYAGYFVVPHRDFVFAGTLTSTYTYHQQFCDGPFGQLVEVKNNVVNTLHNPLIDSIPEMKALGLLLYNMAAQEQVDIYGTIPYVDYKENKEDYPFTFNRMEDIYRSIVNDLDTIVACFDHFETKPDWYKVTVQGLLRKYDRSTQDKSFATWKRLANSLKLRMAMHIVKVAPGMAKRWAEEAVASGVVETREQELFLNALDLGYAHPLYTISNTWNDTRLNASFVNMLHCLRHPYIDYLFDKNSGTLGTMPVGTEVIGIRAGMRVGEGQTIAQNPLQAYSQIKPDRPLAYASLYLMKLSEVQFLRAEGALRGWNMGGDASYFYEQGIRNGQMDERNGTFSIAYTDWIDAYLVIEEPVTHDYVDPLDANNNHLSVTTIGVKWNESDSKEVKLEKIITQKYIAGFPNSYEAWNDLRRTGYPRIFPVLNPEDGDGSLHYGDLIRKIPLPGRDTSDGLDDINNTGIDALGGSDTQATRVWWDVNVPNF